MATDDAASEIIRPRRRGEPHPAEPEPVPAEAEAAAEQEPAVAEVQAEQPPAQPEPQPEPEPEPVEPLAAQVAARVQAALPVAEITRTCSFCCTQQPLSQLDDLGPLMRRCKDVEACTARAASSGMFPQDERALEQGLAAFESRQGALR